MIYDKALRPILEALERHGATPYEPNASLTTQLPDGLRWSMQRAWTSEGYHQNRAQWQWVLQVLRSSDQRMTTDIQHAEQMALPAVVRIYRGFTVDDPRSIEHAARGLSWTLSRKISLDFARRSFGKLGCIAQADVPREVIHTYFGDRYPYEVIVDRPESISAISIKRLPARPTTAVVALAGLASMGFALPRL